MNRPRSTTSGAAALLVALLGLSSVGTAQEPPASAPVGAVAVAAPPSPRDTADLGAFVDGFMASYLESRHLAGAVVAVVGDGELLLARGFGFADAEQRLPVNPERTLFRIGSISKTFVWTSVMQQVEAGKLDLAADVNGYFPDFQVPATYEAPITLTHLMTHTAGLDDHVVGLFAHDAASLRPLAEILRDEMPRRVRPPGQISSYSNHGSAMAMVAVQTVSGENWNDYLERHILEPLDLERTTFEQPLPATIDAELSKGYRYLNGEFKEQPFEFVPLAPIGAASSTATDMARMMITHLDLGALGAVRVFEEATARTMQSDLFRHADGVLAMQHGFYEMSRNGVRIIGHGGDTLWFHSVMALFPEQRLGVFVSLNTAGGDPSELLKAFVDRYFPKQTAPLVKADVDPSRFAGSYRPTRYAHRDFTKVAALVSTLELVAEDGALVSKVGEGTRWFPIGPSLFRAEHEERTLAFGEDASGRVRYAFVGELPVIAFEAVPATESSRLAIAVFGVAVAFFVLSFLAWPVGALLRRWYGVRLDPSQRIGWFARAVLWTTAGCALAGIAALAVSLSDPNSIVFGLTPQIRLHALLTLIASALGAAALALAVGMWRSRRGRWLSRVCYSAVVLGALGYVWQSWIWNLLWWPF